MFRYGAPDINRVNQRKTLVKQGILTFRSIISLLLPEIKFVDVSVKILLEHYQT